MSQTSNTLPKRIFCADPQSEAHQAAMAVAFNTGSSTTVKPDPFLPIYHLMDWQGSCLASFYRDTAGSPTRH